MWMVESQKAILLLIGDFLQVTPGLGGIKKVVMVVTNIIL